MTKYLSLLLLSSLPFLYLGAQTSTLEDINTEAYLSMMDADKLLEEAKPAEALGYYQKSLQAYQSLKTQDPTFKRQIVDYRIDLLQKKIAELKKQVPDSDRQPVPGSAEVSPEEKDFKTLYFQTREKMLQESGRLLDLEKRNIQMTVAMREKLQELQQLQAVIRDLESRLNSARTEQGKETAALEKEVNNFDRFNKLLQEKADKLEIDNRELLATSETLNNAGRELSGDLAVLKAQYEGLQKEVTDTKTNATQSEQRLILSRNQFRDDLDAKTIEHTTSQKVVAELQVKIHELPLLEETVLELNRRNEEQAVAIGTLEANITKSQKTLEAQEGKKQASLALLEPLQTKIETLTNEKITLAKQLTELTANRDQIAATVETAEKSLVKIQAKMAKNLEQKNSSEAAKQKALSEGSELSDQVTALSRENLVLKENLEQFTSTVSSLTEKETEVEGVMVQKNKDLATLAKRLSEVQDSVKEMKRTNSDLLSSNDALQKELTKIDQKDSAVEQQLKNTQVNLDEAQLSQSRNRAQLASLEIVLGKYAEEKKEMTSQLEKVSSEAKVLKEKLDITQDESAKDRGLLRSLEQELENRTEEKNKIETKFSTISSELALVNETLNQTQLEGTRDRAALKRLQNSSEKDLKQKDRLEEGITEVKAELEQSQKSLKIIQTAYSKEAVIRKELEARFTKLDDQQKTLNSEHDRLLVNLDQENEQRKRLEKTAEQQLEAITDRMNEIISLRQKISKLEAAIAKEKAKNAQE